MPFLTAALAAMAGAAAAPTRPQPLQPPATWIADDDYPPSAIRRGAAGTVGFRLEIGVDGRPTACTITASADPELDAATCRIFTNRARFVPAHDRRGRPVAGTYSARIRWVLPPADAGPVPFEPVHVANVVARDEAGNIVCSWSRNGASPEQRTAGECGFLAGSGADDALRAGGRPGAVIAIYDLTPDGMAPAPGNEQAGADLVYEDTARIEIAPDGSLAACQPGEHLVRAAPFRFPPISICMLADQRRAAAANGEPRRGVIALRVYLRGSAAR